MEKIINFKNKILDFIYKYRYIIAILLIIIGVLLKFHGSSINLWNQSEDSPDGVLITGIDNSSILSGQPRSIRSDEWAVTTPLIFSQSLNGFKYFSDNLRGGTTTDAFSIYGLPVLSIAEIFRPFHWGYLLFGVTYGLSFFWIARFFTLFLVTFEFFMIFTNKNKRLSVIASFMISFAPLVQWLFATNGIAEIFIFGELALILLYKYLNTENFKHRLLYLALMILCAGGYVWVLYPAFQIPMFYVFLMLAIYIIIENRKNCKITKKDIISIIATGLIFVLAMGAIIYTSRDSISSMMNTDYPGDRTSKGGGSFRIFISYIDNIFLPYKTEYIPTHQNAEAVMYGLFPIGLICAVIAYIKNKKFDLPTMLLLLPYIIIGIFCMFEIPYYPQLTLLKYSIADRALLAVGFIDILILIRSLAITEKAPKVWISAIISIVTSGILVLICHYLNPMYVGKILSTFLFGMCSILFFSTLEYNTKFGKYVFTYGMIATMIACGFNVNPINQGTDMITDSNLYQAIKEINENDPGIWLAESLPFPCPNYLAMAGAPTINATNIYPNLDLWRRFDPENKYEEIYNRYAHVYIRIVPNKEAIAEKFVLQGVGDKFELYITPDELKDMNIKYIFTVMVMEDFKSDTLDFDLIYNNEHNHHIYRVIYK